MGVLTCSRYRCTNIMCDRYNDEFGFICPECFEELCQAGMETNIEHFMNSDKDNASLRPVSREYFEEVFPKR